MKPRLYLETTVVSYLTARPSRDVIFAGMQATTREWWERRRGEYEVVISEIVLAEAGRGDAEAARRRLAMLDGLPLMRITPAATMLAEAFLAEKLVPTKAAPDAAHVAVAAVSGAHFLLTWNCRHIANAELADDLIRVCQEHGYACPVLCTPHELLVK